MNELKIFENENFGQVRVLEEDGKTLFCGADVAKALGYANAPKALGDHCRCVTKRYTPHPQSPDKTIEMSFIPEGDVYRLITHSKLPQAEAFERWVFDGVLPSIRNTGGYVGNDELFLNTYLPYADAQTKALFKSTLAAIRSLNGRIEEMRPKEVFADAVSVSDDSILIGALAKIIRQNGVAIGQKRLFAWMRDNAYLMKSGRDYNLPTQKAMELGLFRIRERTINNPDGSVRVTKTVLVTGKGQQYFVNKFFAA